LATPALNKTMLRVRLGLLLRFVSGPLRRAGVLTSYPLASGAVMVTSASGVAPVACREGCLPTVSQLAATLSSSSARTVSMPVPQKTSSPLPSAESMISSPPPPLARSFASPLRLRQSSPPEPESHDTVATSIRLSQSGFAGADDRFGAIRDL
jgi:hypothetical protein